MADLLPEILTRIAKLMDPSDLASFRSASTEFSEAVRGAAVRVRPFKEIQPAQLSTIHLLFGRATTLDIRGCSVLTKDALRDLQSLANLRHLCLDSG